MTDAGRAVNNSEPQHANRQPIHGGPTEEKTASSWTAVLCFRGTSNSHLVCTAWLLMVALLIVADLGRASVDGAVPQHSSRQPTSGAGKEEKVASSWAAAVNSKDKPLALYHEVSVISNSSDGQFRPRSVQTTVCSRV